MCLCPTWYLLPPDSTDMLIYIVRDGVYDDGYQVRLTLQQYDTLLENLEFFRTTLISLASLEGYQDYKDYEQYDISIDKRTSLFI